MARFLTESGTLFQHIPRTGGTFVEEVIDSLGTPCNRWICKQRKGIGGPRKHALLAHYQWDQMAAVKRIVCFVRHPVSYYVSTWRYLHGVRLVEYRRLAHMWTRCKWHPFRQAALVYRPDFAEWVDALLEAEPGWATWLMSSYVGPECGEFCDFIGRTETLIPDLVEVLSRIGLPVDADDLIKMGRINVAPSTVPDFVVPAELRARIEREERVLIRRFYAEDTLDKRWFRPPPRRRRFARLPAPGVASPGP